MADDVLLSIVITSYTTERIQDIYELLDSVKKQTYENVEVVFVAERSRGLCATIEAYVREKGIANVNVAFNDGEPGLSAARNIGIKQAHGDILGFVDDDVVLPSGWAGEMVKLYQDESVIGVTGPAMPLWERPNMDWFPEEFYWIFSCTAWSGWEDVREVRNAWGMNMSFRREAFDRAGLFVNECGFHKGPMAEDNEFSLRIKARTGKRILYNPNVALQHRVHEYRLSQKFIKERAYWIGYSRRKIKQESDKGVDNHEDSLGQEHQLLKRIVCRLFPDTIRKLFTHPVVACRTAWVSLVVLSSVAAGYYSPRAHRESKREFCQEGVD